jgi:peroxiredoxin
MKTCNIKIRVLVLTFASFLNIGKAQIDSTNAPYLKTQTIPAFTIINASDSSLFSNKDLKKNLNTVFIIFNPDCEFCQHETMDLLKNINRFKKVIFKYSFSALECLQKLDEGINKHLLFININPF